MLVNKWILLALNIAVVLAGYLGTVDWNTYLPSQAGTIVIVLGAVKAILAYLMPASAQTVGSTGGSIVTHRAA